MQYGFGMSRYTYGFPYGGGAARGRHGSIVTPTQALIASFAGTGLLDALLLFDPSHYSTPGSTPGVLVDALGGPITYTAPNTQATPDAVQDASGYWYASTDGVDDAPIASAAQTVAWYCSVFRSPGPNWGGKIGAPIAQTGSYGGTPNGYLVGSTGWDGPNGYGTPRAVRRNGEDLTGAVAPAFDMAPVHEWMLASVWCEHPTASQLMQLGGMGYYAESFHIALHVVAIAVRYTDPTADQQSQIESRLTPLQQALLASA